MKKINGYPIEKVVRVGMGELKLASPPQILSAILGSCVGVVVYDEEKKIAGMAHVMLPRILKNERIARVEMKAYPGKYATYAVPVLVKELRKNGAISIKAKIAGGANMFPELHNAVLDVGAENVAAVKKLLEDLGIPVVAEDVGGNRGRSVFFDPETAVMTVRIGPGESYNI